MMKHLAKVVVVCSAVALSACVPMNRNHGYVPFQEEIAALVPGVDTKSSVLEAIGSPTTTDGTQAESFYYVQRKLKYYGISAPRETERSILVLQFDRNDVLSNVQQYSKQDGRIVALNSDYTELAGENMPLLRRLFGSIGGMDASRLIGQQT